MPELEYQSCIYFFMYDNEYCGKLLELWKVLLQPKNGIDSHCLLGGTTDINISIPSEISECSVFCDDISTTSVTHNKNDNTGNKSIVQYYPKTKQKQKKINLHVNSDLFANFL